MEEFSIDETASNTNITLGRAFFNKRYAYASWNALVLGFLCEFTGVYMVTLFSKKIFKDMKDHGQLSIPVSVAILILNFTKVVSSIFSSIPAMKFGQKRVLVFG
jgi:hypothetical protein